MRIQVGNKGGCEGPADLMCHFGEGGDVTDLHAGVGGGLQHQQLGVPCPQGLLHSPATPYPPAWN